MAPSPNRRALLLAPLAASVLATTSAVAKSATPAHDATSWAALLTAYEALSAKEREASRRHSVAEKAFHTARALARPPSLPPRPREAVVWMKSVSVILNGQSIGVEGYEHTLDHRPDLERYCRKHPADAAGRLEAWGAWEERCAAIREAAVDPELLQLERRARVLEALWHRALARLITARARLLRYATLDRPAILAKLAIAEEAHDPDDTTPHIANSLLAALGVDGRV